MVIFIASTLAIIQQRSFSGIALLARLEHKIHLSIDEASILERLREPLAHAMLARGSNSGPPLDGTPWSFDHEGQLWEVRLQDTRGLVDIYQAPPLVLDLLPLPKGAIEQGRTSSSSVFLPLEQSLARFGLNFEERSRIRDLVTQGNRDGRIDPSVAPLELREGAKRLPAPLLSVSQVSRVYIFLDLL